MDSFTLEVDTARLLTAIAQLPATVLAHIKPECRVTAELIARDADQRIARRAAGPTRGGKHTAEGITVEETHNHEGYVVYVKSPDMPNLPEWLEFGTKRMTAKPFLFVSARLEETGHRRRVATAIQDAIDERGLGD